MNDYELIASNLEALIGDETDITANLANASALINDELTGVNWVGFYIMKDGVLVLGPFQGKPACLRIVVGRGVCGVAVDTDEAQFVPDVHKFTGHIACDSASSSEIVVPIHDKSGACAAVLDIDSPTVARFSAADFEGIKRVAHVIEKLVFCR